MQWAKYCKISIEKGYCRWTAAPVIFGKKYPPTVGKRSADFSYANEGAVAQSCFDSVQQPLFVLALKAPLPPLCGPPPPCRAVNVNQSHFANACVLGTFSHTTCCPISYVLSDLLLGQVSNGGGFSLWHISFPRQSGGSGERSEPKGALREQPLPVTSHRTAGDI